MSLKQIVGSVVVFIGFLLFMGSWYVVGAGTVGVTFNRITGKAASHSMGIHVKFPIIETVTKFDVKTQREDIKADGASKDLQVVNIETMLNYHLDYTKVDRLYVTIGRDYNEKVIFPAVNESVKAAVALYPVEQIIINRHLVKENIENALKERLANYDIILETLNLVDIDFSPEFNKVVEEKQIEEQKIKTAEYQKRQAEELKQKTIYEAEAEARKQTLLRESVSDKVISLKWIEKWNGNLPHIITGDKGAVLMITPNEYEEKK